MSHFAEAAAASDRARFEVLESASATVLEQVLLNSEFAVPEGSEPFRCATIAGTLERRRHETQTEGDVAGRRQRDARRKTAACTKAEVDLYDAEFARAQRKAAEKAAEEELPDFPEFDPKAWFAQWALALTGCGGDKDESRRRPMRRRRPRRPMTAVACRARRPQASRRVHRPRTPANLPSLSRASRKISSPTLPNHLVGQR